jgi:hypothetical protein
MVPYKSASDEITRLLAESHFRPCSLNSGAPNEKVVDVTSDLLPSPHYVDSKLSKCWA